MNRVFKNRNEILDDINHRIQYEDVKLKELHIYDTVIHIELDKWLCKDILDIFYRIQHSIICSQIIAQGYIAEHVLKESTLDVEGDYIIMNFIINKEFDKNDYQK